jgi:uncharacterized protein YjdB
MKKLLYLLLLALGLGACEEKEAVRMTGISLLPESAVVDLPVGETLQLTATTIPANAPQEQFLWSSGDMAIATVSPTGLVTAVSVGSTIVKARCATISQSITVNVSARVVPLAGLTVSPEAVNLVVEGAQQLIATILPEAATGVTLTYTCTGNGSVATVSDGGMVTAVSPGATTVTVTASAGSATPIIKRIPVKVLTEAVPLTDITVSPEKVDLVVEGTQPLAVTTIPDDATGVTLTYTVSEDGRIATVSAGGMITAVSPGAATVTVTASAEGVTSIIKQIPVTVSAVVVPLTGLTVSPATVSLVVKGEQQLTATPIPDDVTGVTIAYTISGDGRIATVSDDGLVTAVSAGAATVTVTASAEGVTSIIKQIPVTVSAAVVLLTGLTVTPEKVSLVVEGIQQLTAKIIPETATGVTLTYTCTGNGSVATVTDGGLVTAVSPGAATVTVTASAGSATPITKRIPVTVTLPPPPPCEATDPAATAHEWLRLSTSQNQCSMNNQGDYDEIIYTGGGDDPNVFANGLTKAINSDVAYVKFEYMSDVDVEGQVYAFPRGEEFWYTNVDYVRTDVWACKVIALPLHVSHQLVAGDWIRFDPNPSVPQVLRIRNLEILYAPYTPPANPYECANVSGAATAHDYLRLTTDVNGPNCTMSNMGDHDAITYLGGSGDPWVLSTAVSQNANSGLAYVRFEYKSNRDVDGCQLFVWPAGDFWYTNVHYARTNEWTCMSILIPTDVAQRLVAGSKLRFDPNPGEVQVLHIRNLEIQFEPPAAPPPTPPTPGPAINIENMIGWFYDRMYRGTCYNMNARYEVGDYIDLNGNGCVEGDCSSAVMYALRWAGAADWGALNTDSMHAWLVAHGFQVVSEGAGKAFNPQRGDIFIWGRIGQSGGAAGHTGVFLDSDNIIHMTSGCNGICVNNYNQVLYWNDGDNTYEYLYRYVP